MSTLGYNSPLTQQSIRSGLILESELSTVCSAFQGTEDSSALVVESRDEGKRGDTLVMRFAKINATEAPKTKGQTIIGQESETQEYEDSLKMRYFSYDGKVENVPAEQNLVSFNLFTREVSRLALQWAYLKEQWVINQLTGNTLVNTAADYGFSGGNVVTAMDANHTYYAPNSSGTYQTSDANVAGQTTSVLDTRVIDDLITRATSRSYVSWPMAPADTPFGRLFILLCHGEGYQQIRENSSGSDIYDLSKAAIQGGLDISDSPLITGEGFIYDKTLVLRTDFAPQGITGGAAQANTRVAAFFGARAGHWIYGEGYEDGDHLGYSEHQQHRRVSILTDTVAGFKRTIVNGETWGSFRVVHYSKV